MLRLPILSSLMALLLFAAAPVLRAEVVQMPAPTVEKHAFSISLPGRGMTMKAVEARFGKPLKIIGKVGKPPITRWVYNDYTVYFEYQYVIDAVLTNPIYPQKNPPINP